MSLQEEAEGTIFFTKLGFSENVKFIRNLFNERQGQVYSKGLACFNRLVDNANSLPKRATNSERFNALFQSDLVFAGTGKIDLDLQHKHFPENTMNSLEMNLIASSVFRCITDKASKPRKSDFPLLNSRQTSFTIHIDGNTTLTVNKANCTISIVVTEGSNAVKNAYSTFILGSIFNYWNTAYQWKNKEGGFISFRNERDKANLIPKNKLKGVHFGQGSKNMMMEWASNAA